MGTMIQIRNVPEALHRRLKSHAALAGMSLLDYLLSEIRQVAERPAIDELRARLRSRAETAPVRSPAKAVRAERDRAIVVDASALLEVLLRTSAAKAVEDRLFAGSRTLRGAEIKSRRGQCPVASIAF
ncbi:hypothetical protein [Roseiarcus sp.]|uniref:hypothetical protein n=1 Tax=Roseiarcus sp. TaxID=1969460 RepID=UPI003D0C8EEE